MSNKAFSQGYNTGSRTLPGLLLCLGFLLGGCVHQHYPGSDLQAQPGLPEGPLALNWQGEAPRVEAALTDEIPKKTDTFKRKASQWLSDNMRDNDLDHYQIQELQFQSSGINGQPNNRVRLRLYLGDSATPAPLLIILPIWGSYDYPVEKLSWKIRDYYQGNVHIALFLGEDRLLQWQDMADADNKAELLDASKASARNIATTVTDISGLIRWAEQQDFVDPQQISLAGFSIGAVVGGMVAANEPGLANAILVMGAAAPAEVLTACQRIAGRTRETVSERLALSQQDYQEVMAQAFGTLDLSLYAGHVNPDNILVIDANNDECMPRESRDALWHALNQPERYIIKGSHEGAFVSMTVVGFNTTSNIILDRLTNRIDSHFQANTLIAVDDAEEPEQEPPPDTSAAVIAKPGKSPGAEEG